jgi:hypothetical protein
MPLSTSSRMLESSSACVLVTCRLPLRSDTRHCTRRSRSPGRNGRMLSNS